MFSVLNRRKILYPFLSHHDLHRRDDLWNCMLFRVTNRVPRGLLIIRMSSLLGSLLATAIDQGLESSKLQRRQDPEHCDRLRLHDAMHARRETLCQLGYEYLGDIIQHIFFLYRLKLVINLWVRDFALQNGLIIDHPKRTKLPIFSRLSFAAGR